MEAPSAIARTSVELWSALASRYGLDAAGYDRELVDEIGAVLGLPAGDVGEALKTHGVTVEALLHAVLVCLASFAAMVRDLLALYETAAAGRADHPNLLVEYDFGARRPPLAFDLETFRSWAAVTAKATRALPARVWSDDQLWRLNATLRNADRGSLTRTRAAAEWAREYQAGAWPASVPALTRTGRAGLDDLLRGARAVAVDVLRRCRAMSTDRIDLRRRAGGGQAEGDPVTLDPRRRMDDGEAEGDLATLANVDRDSWLGELVDALDRVADRARTDPGLDTVVLERELSAVFESAPTTRSWVEQPEKVLVELLSLPAWNRRHDLYAAWVLTQIVGAAGPKRCKLHSTTDGRLSFSFRGSHVATIATPNHGPVAVWAELRTPSAHLVGKGRKSAIQPDYTLLKAPVTESVSALAVVECKQCRRAGSANFAAALQDYAAGHPTARVLLVNHGPARKSILDRVALVERPRCAIVAHLRADEAAAKAQFSSWLCDALGLVQQNGAFAQESERSEAGSPWATIKLEWSDRPTDLDLHVAVGGPPATIVSYEMPGALDSPPFARLDQDITTGYGPESVSVARPSRLLVSVDRFSNDGTFSTSDARVSLRTPKAEVIVRYSPSDNGDEKTWLVAEVHQDGTVIV
ncbi:hypothetical protein [Asanoa iriomotensis]|uniref:Restriction endonuclease n=1 Tax=Asanoa iriomotensis TaxID=234613 RepID=A0ABQ4C1L5_9ACTN|nr:hypothetical protein [Asanoa iriomotensis]GIF56672.1 hypothetical protein Air01nite_27670 [Asanoa iriomotensis]